MRGIPDPEDGTQSGLTKWMQSTPCRHRAQAHVRTNRKTERVELSGRKLRRHIIEYEY